MKGIICFGIALLINEWINQVNGEHFEQPADKYKEHFQRLTHGDQKYKEHFQKLSQNITTLGDLETFFDTSFDILCRMTLDYIMDYYEFLDFTYAEEEEPDAVKKLSKVIATVLERGCENFELSSEMKQRIIINRLNLKWGQRVFRQKTSGHKSPLPGLCIKHDDCVQWCDSFLDVTSTVLENFVSTKQEIKEEWQYLYESCQSLKMMFPNLCQVERVKQAICAEKNSEYLQQCILKLVESISISAVEEYFLEGDDDVRRCLAVAMTGQSNVRCVTKVCGDPAGNSVKEEFEGRLDEICPPDLRKIVAEWVPITTEY